MTTLLDRSTEEPGLEDQDLERLDPLGPEEPPQAESEPQGKSAVPLAALGLATASAALSAGGAAWMVGGMFRGAEARLVGFLGVLLGCGFVYAGSRLRSAVLGALTLPASLLVGAFLMSSASGAGTSSLPALVKDAATSSQVLQPPIDFAPGWRLILLVVLALLASAAVSLALSFDRPRLAVAVPTPLTVVAALVQPGSTAIVTSAVSVGFVMMGLATSYAADGVGDTFDVGFEVRRLGRSLVSGVLLVGLLVLASRVSFLFPQHDTHHVIPPRRPPVSPPQKDVPLYTVKGALNGPLRIGVIDVYDLKDQAWLLPPVDAQRLRRLHLPAAVPQAPAQSGPQTTVTVTVDQATGHLLPMVAGARSLQGSAKVDYDPRTDGLALAQRPVYTGLRYSITANPAPNGQQLSRVDGIVPADIRPFLQAPPAPPAVQDLLRKAPVAQFARLQYLRAELYKHVIAAGQGRPTDVSPERVVQLLGGATGNPYELTASEALLARWAGVPSRIGYGYYDGKTKSDGSVEFRPANAATYLEVYFSPYGWVPVVGVPPRAQQSLSNDQRNNDPSIAASPELGINVYLPVLNADRTPLYEYVRYYLLRALPFAAGGGAVVLLYPVLLKGVRRRRRREWAAEHGNAGRVAVAYCSLRDHMIDLALPGRGLTPLELVELVEEDEEHAELAWLVTRGLWGDRRGLLTDAEAAKAERLSESVRTRLSKAQPETARLLAAVSRASLRAPHSVEIPNAWVQLHVPRLDIRKAVRRVQATPATALLVVLAVLGLGGCSTGPSRVADPPVPFPTRLAPAHVAGLQVHDEPKAEQAYLTGARDKNVVVSTGKVLSFNKDGLVQAALQVAQLKRGFRSSDRDVVTAITRSVGSMTALKDEHGLSLYYLSDGTQRIFLWFPTVKSMALLVVRAQISEGASEALARGLVDYGQGGTLDERALEAAFASASSTASPSPTPTPSTEQTP